MMMMINDGTWGRKFWGLNTHILTSPLLFPQYGTPPFLLLTVIILAWESNGFRGFSALEIVRLSSQAMRGESKGRPPFSRP